MAYITGTANDISALRTAIFNACTANGWTLSGEILHKGTAYFRLQISGSDLTLLGGTGKDGSNNLTGGGTTIVQITNDVTAAPLTYPMTYHIHINSSPDEVYVVANYSTDFYQWCAFGQSHITFSAGTGNWYGAFGHATGQHPSGISITPTSGGNSNGASSGALFWHTSSANVNAFIHHGLDGNAWSGLGSYTTTGGAATAITALIPLVGISPNSYNGEAVLLPIPVTVSRPSSLYSLVAQPKHSRYIRIDNHAPGQVITIGAEQWKVYPWLSKNSAARDGNGSNINHSGTFGWAIRYTP